MEENQQFDMREILKGYDLWDEHDSFFKATSHKDLFAKVVFDSNITDEEIISEKSARKRE